MNSASDYLHMIGYCWIRWILVSNSVWFSSYKSYVWCCNSGYSV